MHRISVIIPAYNEEKYIARCLDALKKQQTNILYEVIVVDNGSTDATSIIAKKYDVRLIHEQKKGYARAVATGLKRAKYSIIALIDADTIVPTMWLQQLHKLFLRHPKAICVGGPGIFYDGHSIVLIALKILNKIAMSLGVAQPMGFNMAIRKKAKTFASLSETDIELQWDRHLVNSIKPYGEIIFSKTLAVSMSSRRWRSPKIIISEASKRLINIISLATIKKTIFYSFEDYR